MKNSRLVTIIFILLVLRIIMTVHATDKDTDRTFINTSINKEEYFNKSIALGSVNITTDVLNYIQNEQENYDEVIYINNGALIIYDENNIKYLTSIRDKNDILNNNSEIVEYKDDELKQIIYTDSNKFISNSTIASNNKLLIDNINDINKIKMEEYIEDIINILKGDNDNKYFEPDVLTNEIISWANENITDNSIIKPIVGVSEASYEYVDRICILGISSESSSKIDIKIILKLNDIQKIYGIDIY